MKMKLYRFNFHLSPLKNIALVAVLQIFIISLLSVDLVYGDLIKVNKGTYLFKISYKVTDDKESVIIITNFLWII